MTVLRVVSAVAVVLALAGGSPPAGAQSSDLSRVRVLAVAPFSNDDPLTRPLAEWGATRLSALLRGGRFRVIESPRVAEEMKRLGIAPTDLISPSRTIAVGQQLGADAVLTGRVVQIFQEGHGGLLFPDLSGGEIESRVVIDFRILEVGTRLKLFEDEVACSGIPAVAVVAMECVVRNVASRLGRN